MLKSPIFRRSPKARKMARSSVSKTGVSMSGVEEPSFVDRRKVAHRKWSAKRSLPRVPRSVQREKLQRASGSAFGEGAAAAAQLLREKEEAVARQAALEAEQKAARDARYAARKNKKR